MLSRGEAEYAKRLIGFRVRASAASDTNRGFIKDAVGDQILACFESAGAALRYALLLFESSFSDGLPIRVAIHRRPEGTNGLLFSDATTMDVNIAYTERLLTAGKVPGVVLSDSAREKLLAEGWEQLVTSQEQSEFRDFGLQTVWRVALQPTQDRAGQTVRP